MTSLPHALTFMRTLSLHIRNWYAPWKYASVPSRMPSMHISFSIYQMFILTTLSMHIRNWCVHWAFASGTDVYVEHTCQELMRALSIHVRNKFVHWAQSLQNMLSIGGLQGFKLNGNQTKNERYLEKNNFLLFAKCLKMYSFFRFCILRLQKVLLWPKKFFLEKYQYGYQKHAEFYADFKFIDASFLKCP